MNYYFTKFMTWFAYVVFLIANSTGCNPRHVRVYFEEWQQWERYLEILELYRRASQ